MGLVTTLALLLIWKDRVTDRRRHRQRHRHRQIRLYTPGQGASKAPPRELKCQEQQSCRKEKKLVRVTDQKNCVKN